MSLTHVCTEQQRYQRKRALLGLYVFAHFVALVPYAAELFSSAGMLGRATASPLIHAFPNVLAYVDGPGFLPAFVALGALGALCLACGVYPRAASLAAYYVWACLFGRNPLIANPSLPYVGLMLLACAVVGKGPANPSRKHFERVTTLLWIAMAAGYSYSGLTKLSSISWLDGSGVEAVLRSPLARPTALRSWLLSYPTPWLAYVTYAALLLELLFAPLTLCAKLRPWLWLAMTGMHLSLLVLIQFADLSMGMLVLHAFTFDPHWLEGLRALSRRHGLLKSRGEPSASVSSGR